MWNVRNYLLDQWEHLTVPPENTHLQSENDWRHLILNAGGQQGYVYLSKRTANGRKTVNYRPSPDKTAHLGRPPGALYLQCNVGFTYLDHRTQTYQQETLSQTDMLRRVIQHIPEKSTFG
jgi:hypothetical protein